MMTAGEMKELRRKAGMSQADLGEAIGMARETIGAMERGTAPIELRTGLAVLHVIGGRSAPERPTTPPDGDAFWEAVFRVLDGRYRRINPAP